MSLQIPESPAAPGGAYHSRPAEYTQAVEKALALFKEHLAADESSWELLPEKEEVKLAKKATSDDAYDIPLVKGVTTVEGATPAQVLATIQLPGLRKKWDPRFAEGHAIARYSPNSYEFYSLMNSPSYFIWQRDIVGVQENFYQGDDIVVIQTSVQDEDNLPDAGSYAKSRTRATVDVSGWKIAKKGNDTELTYVVKVHLNGSIPTSIVSTIANETPLCTARVRDVHYTVGYHPYELHTANGGKTDSKTVNVTQTFTDDKGEKKWSSVYTGVGSDNFEIQYDGKRMYSGGVAVDVSGAGASEVKTTVDEGSHIVAVQVGDGAKDKEFTM